MTKGSGMLIPVAIMLILAIILLVIGYQKGVHISGIKTGFGLLVKMLPLLILALIIAGMVQVLVPQEMLSRLIGQKSGMRGILIGSLAGALTPGGPYTNFPIVAVLLNSGASIGTCVAFVTGWSLYAITRIPLEIGIIGWRFALARFVSTFLFPPIAGLLAQVLFGGGIKN